MDEWLEYLYVIGVLNDDNYRGNTLLKDLVYKYRNSFPDNPIEESFFFDNTQEEQIRLLSEALSNNELIKKRGK